MLLFCLVVPKGALAQVREITDPGDIYFKTPQMRFNQYPEGAVATDLLSSYGIVFEGVNGAMPRIIKEPSLCSAQAVTNVIRNESVPQPTTNTPLRIRFKFPLRQLGIDLGGTGTPLVSATIKAFDSNGGLLGEVTKNLKDVGRYCSQFVGLESTADSWISMITIDYGNMDEEIVRLILVYVDPPRFVTYLPQVATGEGMVTQLDISNATTVYGRAVIRFFDDQGEPLTMSVGNKTQHTFEVEVAAFYSETLRLEKAEGTLKAGYARIEADVPLQAAATFRAVDRQGRLIAEAAIRSTNGRSVMVGRARMSADGEVNTGIAIVNTSDSPTLVEISASFWSGKLELNPGEHRAMFLDELAPLYRGREGDVALYIRSPQPVAVAVLQTFQGWPSADLPLAAAER